MTINFGVIGAGGIANRRTIPEGILKAKGAKLAAVMDSDVEKVEELAKKYNVKGYLKEKDIILDKDIDALYIATPSSFHYKQVVESAKAGKHILCEKPLALTLKQGEEMISVCKKNKVKLQVGFMMRFHTYHCKIKEEIKQGKLGQLVFGRAQLSCWYPLIKGAWRQDYKIGGGGSLIDMASHCLDLLEMFFGKVSEIHSFTNTLVHDYKVEDTATTLVRFKSGAHGVVDTNFNIPDSAVKNVLEVYGTKGSILASNTIGQGPAGTMFSCFQEQKDYSAKQVRGVVEFKKEEYELKPVNTYLAEIESFIQAIENDTKPEVSGEDGLWNLKLVKAAYDSSKTGKVIVIG